MVPERADTTRWKSSGALARQRQRRGHWLPSCAVATVRPQLPGLRAYSRFNNKAACGAKKTTAPTAHDNDVDIGDSKLAMS